MDLTPYDFSLPPELIANSPAKPRDHSRLLVLDKATGDISHHHFYDLPDILKSTDVLVFNQTKVFPARLFGTKSTLGKVEVLLIKQKGIFWHCLTRPGLKTNQTVDFGEDLSAVVHKNNPDSTVELLFNRSGDDFFETLDRIGHMPLPPYIHSADSESKIRDEYQTVYAKTKGSAAAPTAGLHFTKELLDRLKAGGVQTEFVTLHVGLGTFKPLTQANIDTDSLHSEYFELDRVIADRLNSAKKAGRRIIAVGTTTTRVLETVSNELGQLDIKNLSGNTSIFIHPPYHFKFVDGMITNFHLPKTSLLMLVSSLVKSPEYIKAAYQTAIKEKYRFYSFGDAMLIT